MQFIALNLGFQVSTGYVTLPGTVIQKAGTDSWISITIGWVIALAACLIVVQVMKKFPDGTLLDLLTRYGGKWVGKAGAALFALIAFYTAYLGLIYAVMIIKTWHLPNTPAPIIEIMLLIPTYLISRQGARILGRYFELLLFFSLWIPLVYLLPLKDAHWLHLLPPLKEGWKPIFSAVPETMIMFWGFSANTFMFYPFLLNKKRALTAVVISSTLSFIMYVFITIVCLVNFSPDGINQFEIPTISVLKTLEYKFVERVDVIFISFYLPIFTLSWISFLYMTAYCSSWLVGKQDHRAHLRVIILLLAIGAYFFIPTTTQLTQFSSSFQKIVYGLEYVFPVCLLIFIWICGCFKRRKTS